MPTISDSVKFENLPNDEPDRTFPGPGGPTEIELNPQHVSSESASFERWTYRGTTAKRRIWTMTFNLTAAEYISMEDMIFNILNGPANTFTYVHTDGESYGDALLVNDTFRFTRRNDNEYSIQLRIQISQQIDNP